MNKRRLVFWAFLFLAVLAFPFALADEDAGSIVASPSSGVAPLLIDFTLRTPLTVSSYAWDFDSDGRVESTIADPSYTYPVPGRFLVTLTVSDANGMNTTFTKSIMVSTPMAVSLTATPQSGVAPLTVLFNSIATGRDPITYNWDFNGDGSVDSTIQNPSHTFDAPGEYNVTLKVMDGDGSVVTKIIPVTVVLFDSNLVLKSYFPTSLSEGENQVTFLLHNNGTETLEGITGKLVGDGLQHLTSTELALLKAGEEDSITIKVNVLKSGALTGTAKVLDKRFPITFQIAGQTAYTKEELELQLQQLKDMLQEQERVYYDKKSEGYLVAEIFDSIKSVKSELQKAQQNILTKKYVEAKVSLDLASSQITDVTESLSEVRKQEVDWTQWLKENAVAITAVVAALGTLSGILLKVKSHAAKLGEDVKKKITSKKGGAEKETKGSESSEEKKPETKRNSSERRRKRKEKKEEAPELDDDNAANPPADAEETEVASDSEGTNSDVKEEKEV